MPLPRLHLFELEDQPWFPDLLRRGLTDYLATITARTAPYAPAAEPLVGMLKGQHEPSVRDFCSGAGGPWPQLWPTLSRAVPSLHLELTDAFPNVAALDHFAAGDAVTYRSAPLRASDVWPPAGASLATFFSSFHHFRPVEARQILLQASRGKTPVAIFEVTHRSVAALAMMCLAPIAVLFLTPTIRPFRWWRLLFTYLVPVLPLVILWDGLVSCWRTYRPDELLALAASVPESGMEWQAGASGGRMDSRYQ